MAHQSGNSRNNILIGGSGNDVLEGKGGNDLLIGLGGNDTLDGGTGHDIMIGGQGSDLYVVDSNQDVVLELVTNKKGGGFADEVASSISFSLVHLQNIENLVLAGTGNLHGTGNAARNLIIGNEGDNVLDGRDGNDTLIGGGGSDAYHGGAGKDSIVLGSGDPLLVDGGKGIDTVVVEGYGGKLDLTGDLRTHFENVEIMDLSGGSNNTLILDRDNVMDLAGTNGGAFGAHTLLVKGNDADQVDLVDSGWVKGAEVTHPFGIGGSYQTWTNGDATLLVQDGVAVLASKPGDIDLGTLTPDQGFTMTGAAIVGSAGDVNGDGLDDVIVGAPSADPFGRTDAGESYVVYGKLGGLDDLDLSALTAADGFKIDGAAAGDSSGRAVGSASDVNGDGFDDIIVGAPLADPDGHHQAGQSFVIFGKEGGPGDIDLATLTADQGFTISGPVSDPTGPSGDQSGRVVGSAGDLNGDGVDDLFVGALHSYVIYGSTAGLGDIDLASLTSTQGSNISGVYGLKLASAGDINGDGIDDLVLSTKYASPYDRDSAGQAYVVYGRAGGIGDIDLTTLTAPQGFKISGAHQYDNTGFAVSGAGDINGDGIADIIIGSRGEESSGFYAAGLAYVIYGKVGGLADIDLAAALTSDQGFTIKGDTFGQFSSTSVSGAGDVNGDGIDDLIVDGAHVIYGKAGGLDNIAIADLTPDQGFGISAGQRVSAAGDVNGDGFADLILGTGPSADLSNGQFPDGPTDQSYVIYGGDFTGAVTHIGTTGDDKLDGTTDAETFVGGPGNDVLNGGGGGDVFHGGAGNDTIVLGAGDPVRVDGGNGVDTVQLDAFGPELDLTGNLRGRFQEVEIFDLGGTDPFNPVANTLILDAANVAHLAGSNGDAFGANTVLVKGDAVDHLGLTGFGWSQGAVVTDPYGNLGSYTEWHNGASTVLVESDVGVSADAIALANLSPPLGFKVEGAASVSDAGDVNADGIDDFAVSGSASYIIYGNATGSGDIDLASLTADQGFVISRTVTGDDSDLTARSAGDVNGDGIDDLIIGAAFADTTGGIDAGESYVVFGKDGGLGNIDVATLSATEGYKISGAAAGDWSGFAVDTAGDFNGDGIDDLIVSARNADPFGRSYAGESYLIFGQSGGSGDIDLAALAPGQGFKISGANFFDYSGWSVSTAGDVNGDGLDDVIIGAPIASGTVGFAYVIYGTQTAPGDIDLAALTASQGFTIRGISDEEFLGNAVSGVGDINGDGINDFVVGSYRGGYASSGIAYFVYGKEGGLGDVDLTTLNPDQGFKAFGFQENGDIGRSVSAAGDVNGDGINDVIIGAPAIDALGHYRSGESYVIYGKEGGHGDIDLTALTPDQGFGIAGVGAYDRSGQSVSGAGDINGDGFADLLVGSAYAGTSVGESYVIYGGNFTGSVTHQGTAGDDALTGTAAAESFVGGLGNDVLNGGGGADGFHGGAGDDQIHVADGKFLSVDGGGGFDTLHLDFAGAIDFGDLDGNPATANDARIFGVEAIDADNGASNAMTLHLADVLAIDADAPDLGGTASLDNVLKIDGNAGDTLALAATDGWGSADTASLAGYAVYTVQSVKIAVDQDIAVTVS